MRVRSIRKSRVTPIRLRDRHSRVNINSSTCEILFAILMSTGQQKMLTALHRVKFYRTLKIDASMIFSIQC